MFLSAMATSTMSDDKYDIDNVCRTCLTYTNDLQSIFQICASSTLPVQLDSLIMSISKVEVRMYFFFIRNVDLHYVFTDCVSISD